MFGSCLYLPPTLTWASVCYCCGACSLLPQSTVRIQIEYHSVCPLVGIGTPPPLTRKRVCPSPPEPKGGGHTRLEKKLSTLPTLWLLPSMPSSQFFSRLFTLIFSVVLWFHASWFLPYTCVEISGGGTCWKDRKYQTLVHCWTKPEFLNNSLAQELI